MADRIPWSAHVMLQDPEFSVEKIWCTEVEKHPAPQFSGVRKNKGLRDSWWKTIACRDSWVACLTFLAMGALIIWSRERSIVSDGRLTRPGMWAGFLAGVAVILGNPKAILFYMGVLPGFFDVGRLAWQDIALVCVLSVLVPLAGNFVVAGFIGQVRRLLASPQAVARTNLVAGILLIAVGLAIPFTQVA